MPRSSGIDGRVVSQRAALENVMAVLVRLERTFPIVSLRIDQAMVRSGLVDLLAPALDEMTEMDGSIQLAKSNIVTALAKLME